MMRSAFIIVLNFLTVICHAQSVKFEWVKQMGGTKADGGKDIAIDAAGNVFSTGFFTGTVDFDPGPGIFNLTAPLTNEEDIFITKFDDAGNFIWAKQISGNFLDVTHSIKLDAQGNIYLTGIFFSICDFDPGPGIFNLVSAGNEDIFIAKLNASGNFLWAKRMGSGRFDRGNYISLDAVGNLYVTGFFLETVDFDPGPAVYNLTAEGGEDMFIAKFDFAGNFIWVKQMGGLLFEGGYSIEISAAGNIYTAGIFLGTSDFDPSASVFQLNSSGLSDAFVCKLDAAGNFKWAKRMGGNSFNRCLSMALDENENIYTTGFFDKQVDFDPGPADGTITSFGEDDMYLCKLDSNGNFIWNKQIGGASYDAGYAVTVDATGNVYTAGYFQGLVDFDPGPGIFNLSSIALSDIFILKLTADGNFIWVKTMGGNSFDRPNSIKVDAQNNIYTIGYFGQTVDFDPGPSVFNLVSNGENDIYVHKMSQCLATTTTALTASTCNNYILNGQVYNASGIYNQVLINAEGCDSIITLNLTITRIVTFNDVTTCQDQPYFAAGIFQTNSGIYTDTLLSLSGCDSVIVTNLTVNPSPQPNLGPDRNLCMGESITLDPGVFLSYVWNDNSVANTITTTTPGLYWVRVSNANNCSATDSFTIQRINSLPANFLPANQSLCKGAALNLNIAGYKNYTWSSGETTSSVTLRAAGKYELLVTDFENCVGRDSIVITQKTDCIPIAIPNSFTPNNDGLNDVFKPIITQEVIEYSMVIFNRWGQKIFESKKISMGWNGYNASGITEQGVYVYIIRYRNFAGEWSQNKGTVNLLK